jgi:hypothetical protein
MGIKTLNYILATLGLAGHVFLATALIRRKLAARLPLFTTLVVFYVLRSGILLLVDFSVMNAVPYWILIALDPVLQGILYATIVVAWWPSARQLNRVQTLAASGLVVMAAGWAGLAAWYVGPSSHFSPENLSIKAGVFFSVLWIEAGLALAASCVGLLSQLPRFTRIVVLGFAIYSAANVITEIGHTHFARARAMQPYLELSYMRIGAYFFCLGLWIAACSREPRIAARRAAAYTSAA